MGETQSSESAGKERDRNGDLSEFVVVEKYLFDGVGGGDLNETVSERS